MSLLWTYKFEDGTERVLVGEGFSGIELEKMVELHGKVVVGAKKRKSHIISRLKYKLRRMTTWLI